MYGYIKGIITEINNTNIIIENNNIGYIVNTINPFSFKMGEEVKIYIYEHIKEDEHTLYGFKKKSSKELFLKLISVKGLGPKTAIPLVEDELISNIESAIDREDISYLKKFPKIGDKVAKQIILDLKGKLTNNEVNNKYNDLTDALLHLGYKNNDIKKILPNIKETNIESQLKEALKLLLK